MFGHKFFSFFIQPLFYIVYHKQWHCKVVCHHFKTRAIAKTIIKVFSPIIYKLGVCWIKIMNNICMEAPCILWFPHVMKFVMNLHIKLSWTSFLCNYFWCKVQRSTNLDEMSNLENVVAFHLFLEDFDRKKSHWMLVLILDLKSMHLISSYIGCENLHWL